MADSSIRRSFTRSIRASTRRGGRVATQRWNGHKDSAHHRNFASAAQSSVASTRSSAESRYELCCCITMGCGSVYPMSRCE